MVDQTLQKPPSNTVKIGEYLRSLRERNGVSLKDMADVTRIRMLYLEAIEEGRIDKIPSPAYSLGFIRTYARFFRLDEDHVINLFKEEHASIFDLQDSVKPSLEDSVSIEKESEKPRRFHYFLIFFFLIVGASLFYSWQDSNFYTDVYNKGIDVWNNAFSMVQDSFQFQPEEEQQFDDRYAFPPAYEEEGAALPENELEEQIISISPVFDFAEEKKIEDDMKEESIETVFEGNPVYSNENESEEGNSQDALVTALKPIPDFVQKLIPIGNISQEKIYLHALSDNWIQFTHDDGRFIEERLLKAGELFDILDTMKGNYFSVGDAASLEIIINGRRGYVLSDNFASARERVFIDSSSLSLRLVKLWDH